MTVRQWYRIQRKALWDRDPSLAGDLDTIARSCLTGSAPDHWCRCGTIYWIEGVENYLEQERVLELVRRDMEAAMQRLLHTLIE